MNEDEINKLLNEMEESTQAERAEAAEYAKLSCYEKTARKKGLANAAEYRDWLAQRKGHANNAEYNQDWLFRRGKGTGLSMTESKNSSAYLGNYIAERILPKIFIDPVMMPHGNRGFDATCRNGFNIDVKSSVLGKANFWLFHISHNKLADAFLCIAFDNRIDLNVKHIWLFPANVIVRKSSVNELSSLSISDTEYSLSRVAQYELTDKLDDANNACIAFKRGDLK